jgi:phage-related protein
MHMQDLADAMSTGLAAKMAVAHVSITDMNAALAVFGDNNIRGAHAGTLLASTIRVMEGPSGAAQKKMAKLGISAQELGVKITGPGGLVSAISYLDEKLAGKTHAEKYAALTQMFGSKQAGGVLILIDQLERLKQKEEAVRQGGQKFAADWTAYTKTAAYHLASMGAAMQASGVTIGDILLPIVSELTNKIASAVQWFDGLSASTKKFILIGAGVAAAIGPVLSVLGSLVSFVGALAGLSAVAATILGVAAAVVVVGGAIAAAVIWPKQFEALLEKLGLSASQAATVIHVLQQAFADIKAVVQVAVQVVEALWAQFGGIILAQARTVWNTISGVIQGALNIIRGLVNVFAGLYHGDWNRVWQGIKQIFSGAWQVITSLLTGALQTIEHYFQAEGRIWRAILEAVWHAISASASSAWDGLTKVVGKAADDVANIVRRGFDKVIAFIKSLPGELAALGEAAGKALLTGVAKGIEDEISGVISVANKAKNAVKSVWHAAFGSTPDEWGNYAVGTPLMQGIAQGIAAQEGNVKGAAAKAKQSLKDSLEAKDIYALVVEYGRTLGLKQAEGVVGGILQGTPSIVQQARQALVQATQQARQAVLDARSSFTQAFGQLASDALNAFDQKVQAWVSPAQKLLDQMQIEDQVKAAADAVTQAQDQLTQAQAALAASTDPDAQALANLTQQATNAQIALDNLKASGSASKDALGQAQSAYDQAAAAVKAFTLSHPGVSTNTDTQSLIAAVTSAQQQVAAAKRAQTELELQQEAAQQQAAFTRRMATQREQMAKQLVELRKELLKHPAAWKTMGVKVEDVLKEYGVRMVPSGQTWASMFANGIRQGIPQAEAAAKALAEAVDRYMPHSPAKVGPLSRLPNWSALLEGLDSTVGVANRSMAQLSAPAFGSTGARPTLAPASNEASGDVILQLDGEVLARFTRRELNRKGRRNVGLTFGTT